MKALVLEEYGRFEYTEVPEPDMGPEEVMIAVEACGICGSDVHGMDGSTGRRKPPIIMGHEASGVITAVGADVRGWKEGDRVTFDSTLYCGTCHSCRRGAINLCDNRRVLGVSCDEYRCHGAFAEYVAVPQRILYRLPDALSFEAAAMTEPLSVGVHAVARTPVAINGSAVVVGTGMVGLLLLQVLRASGCGTVIAVDLEQAKLDLAQDLGANVVLKADACDVAEEVKQRTDGRGADMAFEVVGVTPAVNAAIESLRKGGSLTLVGNLSPTIELPLQAVVTRELTLYGTCGSQGEYPACLDLIARKAVNVDPLISAVAPLSEAVAWFDRLYKKEPGLMKVMIKPQGDQL